MADRAVASVPAIERGPHAAARDQRTPARSDRRRWRSGPDAPPDAGATAAPPDRDRRRAGDPVDAAPDATRAGPRAPVADPRQWPGFRSDLAERWNDIRRHTNGRLPGHLPRDTARAAARGDLTYPEAV